MSPYDRVLEGSIKDLQNELARLRADNERLRAAVWKEVGECLAGMPHSEVSEIARRKIENAIQRAMS